MYHCYMNHGSAEASWIREQREDCGAEGLMAFYKDYFNKDITCILVKIDICCRGLRGA